MVGFTRVSDIVEGVNYRGLRTPTFRVDSNVTGNTIYFRLCPTIAAHHYQDRNTRTTAEPSNIGFVCTGNVYNAGGHEGIVEFISLLRTSNRVELPPNRRFTSTYVAY